MRGSDTSVSPIPVLGGSWRVTSGVISRATIVITHIRGLDSIYNYP